MKTIFSFILLEALWAHPHTFIEVKPTLHIEKNIINKLHVKWVLDGMTSMMLIMELDSNGNGTFEHDENSFIYENYFSSLASFNFYMTITSNNTPVTVKPTNFKASIKNDKLIYAFDIEENLDTKDLKVTFFDPDLFVGLMIKQEHIIIKGEKGVDIEQLKQTIFGVN